MEQMSASDLKVFIGTDAVGKRLKQAIRDEAEKKYHGKNTMSRLVVRDFCEKYGYDPKTGKKVRP